MKIPFKIIATGLLFTASINIQADTPAPAIHVNQLGFLPDARKIAIVPPVKGASTFSIVKAGTDKIVFKGKLSSENAWLPAEERTQFADFSALKKTGDFQLKVDGLPASDHFTIADDEYVVINHAALKYYYLNRASTPIEQKYAGKYARAAGHPDDHVLVHASAATEKRPEGTVLSSPKGWYDAGDYNKYIVNSGISTYTLLAAYEHFPQYYGRQAINIPRDKGEEKIPDLLVEAMWNLQWMLTMQDEDGGVYHKLTTKLFDPFEMPDKDLKERYVVQKTTAATLDFAAVMAVASRVYSKYENVHPGLAAKMRNAAEHAWQWA
ncbi:MAG: glycoside hydrolase family 9 protein, partial [Steroidobacter sp.]